jgi:DNA-binding response OmpR family regulator
MDTGPEARRWRVLIVEDDPLVAHLIERILASTFDTVLVGDGEAAVRVVDGNEPLDAVVLDLMLPRLSGRQVWERIRTIRPALARATVVVTGSGAAHPDLCALAAAGVPYLLKPFEWTDLVERLHQCCDAVADVAHR